MSTQINKDLNALHPKVKDLALKLLEACTQEGLNIGISETYRTAARQDYLYAQGRTRQGNIVTYSRGSSMSSYHQWRLAFDVYNNVASDAYNIAVLKRVGALGEALGLEWGGNWRGFKDMPHFQYTFGLSIADLNAGKRPPTFDAFYEESVKILAEKGMMNTPNFWINLAEVHTQYTQYLIINIARSLRPEISLYKDAVQELVNQKIINSPQVWLDTAAFTLNNIRSLIKKAAQLL